MLGWVPDSPSLTAIHHEQSIYHYSASTNRFIGEMRLNILNIAFWCFLVGLLSILPGDRWKTTILGQDLPTCTNRAIAGESCGSYALVVRAGHDGYITCNVGVALVCLVLAKDCYDHGSLGWKNAKEWILFDSNHWTRNYQYIELGM